MTQEEKQLLLKDICGRLPYGVIANVEYYDASLKDAHIFEDIVLTIENINKLPIYWISAKPYLRPMSSMTKEELKRLKEAQLKDTRLYAESLTKAASGDTSMRGKVITHFAADWCDKNHFDYRGLIPMGLALELPKDMYETE